MEGAVEEAAADPSVDDNNSPEADDSSTTMSSSMPVLRKRHFHKRRSQDVIELASRTLTRKASQTYHAPKSTTTEDAFKAPPRNKILLMPMNNSLNGKPKKRMHINERIDMTRRGELQMAGPEQIDEYDRKKTNERGMYKDIELKNK